MGLGNLDENEVKISFNIFSGGLQDTADDLVKLGKADQGKMTPAEARAISNVDFSKDGIIKSRAGVEKYTTVALLEEIPTSLGFYQRQSYS